MDSYLKGWILYLSNQHERAEWYLSKAEEFSPNTQDTLYYKSILLKTMNQEDEAIEAIDTYIVSLKKEDFETCKKIGLFFEEIEYTQKAVAWYEKTLQYASPEEYKKLQEKVESLRKVYKHEDIETLKKEEDAFIKKYASTAIKNYW